MIRRGPAGMGDRRRQGYHGITVGSNKILVVVIGILLCWNIILQWDDPCLQAQRNGILLPVQKEGLSIPPSQPKKPKSTPPPTGTPTKETKNPKAAVLEPIGNYVVFSTTISNVARNMDYAYLAPLVARNWYILGFRPILFVVASNPLDIQQIRPLWDIILPPETRVIPLLTSEANKTIPVAQITRLYAASILKSFLHEDSFLRTTDSDVFLLNPTPFEPPNNATIDITIYNGDCCLGDNVLADGRHCNQYPMHAPGMKVSMWRKLFPLDYDDRDVDELEIVTKFLDDTTEQLFPGYSRKTMKHGSEFWYMDQILLGCAVDGAKKEGYAVELEYPQPRLHVEMELDDYYADVHLAGFKLKDHKLWMDYLVGNSILLMGNRPKYKAYTNAWIEFHNITLTEYEFSQDIFIN